MQQQKQPCEEELAEQQEKAFANAILAKVVFAGRGDTYIAAMPFEEDLTGGKSVTLAKTCWIGNKMPRWGQIIQLAQVEQFDAGWRAQLGRANELKPRKK